MTKMLARRTRQQPTLLTLRNEPPAQMTRRLMVMHLDLEHLPLHLLPQPLLVVAARRNVQAERHIEELNDVLFCSRTICTRKLQTNCKPHD